MVSVLGQLDDSAAFDEVTWRERRRKKPYWRNLHDWAQENLRIEDFEPLYSNIGRPSVCPVHTFLATLIQLEKGYSDREMEEASECDERVKYALLVKRDLAGIDAVTLCRHRSLLFANDYGRKLLVRTVSQAIELGIFSPGSRAVVDSFMVWGARAATDTYTLIRKAIRMVLKLGSLCELEQRMRLLLDRSDYDIDGKPEIDWEDAEQKRLLLQSLVDDGVRLAKFAQSEGMPDDIRSAGELLERISTQDVEICKETGRVELRQGVSRDRVISVADPEMRHGRKTSSLKSDGYKAYIATVGDNAQIIADVVVTPANAADSEPVPEMVDRIEEATGSKPEEIMGDSAYSGEELEEKLAEKQVELVAKIPAPVNKKGLFTKDDFEIEESRGFVMCPAKQYAYFDINRLLNEHKVVRADFRPDVCNNCELESRCTESSKGRTIRVRPHEAKRRAKRRHQKTAEFREKYSRRALTEQRIAHCTRHGGRVSRFVGRAKTEFQELLVAVNRNIQEIMRVRVSLVTPERLLAGT